jgi:hypothetical protein
MERRQLFDLLGSPVAQAPGGVIVFQEDGGLRYLELRAGRVQERDLAVDQHPQAWMLSQRELLLRLEGGARELAFEVASFGAPMAARDFYPTLVELVTPVRGARYFLLNTTGGAWVLEIQAGQLRALHSTALPFLGTCSWYRGGRMVFGGMELRRREAGVGSAEPQWCPARPALLSIRVDDHESRLDVSPASIERLVIPSRWAESLGAHDISARQISQLTPECCLAAAVNEEGGTLLIGVLSPPARDNPLDELAVRPLNVEYVGCLFVTVDASRVLSCRLFRHVLGTLRSSGALWAYTADNRGAGGSVGSLSRIAFDESGIRSEEPITFAGIDASAICAAFRPRFHPRIGYFGTALIRPRNARPMAHYLQSDDALTWRVLGREGEVPPFSAQVPAA